MLTPSQVKALDMATKGHSLLITGQCGTGKTHLLRIIIDSLKKKCAVTSTTGMAARLLGPMAQTIHHWSGIGDARLTKEELLYNFQTDDRFADARKRILASQILIIDEIGMLSEATFEKVELVCRLAKGNLKPFGGLQVIASGDFKQLPPVPKHRYHDPGNYAFQSQLFKNVFPHHINLATVVRQTDATLVKAINQLCDGCPDEETEQFLKSLSRPLQEDLNVCRLFGTKFDAAYINQVYLDAAPGDPVTFRAHDEGKLKELKNSEADKILTLKVGAPIILIRNLPGGLFNGMQGTVHSLQPNKDPVFNFNGRLVSIPRVKFEEYNPATKTVLATRYQYPVLLAYALTVHRAQGQTHNNVEIDCYSFFTAGQMGVAVGRCVSVHGLRILNYNSRAAHLKHPDVVYNFYRSQFEEPRDDMMCCEVPDEQEKTESCASSLPYRRPPSGGSSPDTMTPSGDSSDIKPPSGGSSPDTMTPSGDSSGMPPSGGSSTDTMTPSGDSSPDTMHSNAHNSETDTAGEVTGFENPWELNEFFQSYNTATFMPNQISLGFLKAVSQHTNALYCKAKALVDMKKKTNEDATKIYKAMYKFLASDEHSRMCGKLKDSPKPQKLSAKLLIWLLGKEFNRIASEITETQVQAIDGMPDPTVEISSAAGAKIRYIAGACLHKILSQLRTIVQKNIGIATKKGKAQRDWNYKLQRLLKGLRITEEQVMQSTTLPDSLSEIEYRQGPSRGLFHVSDSVFDFFVEINTYLTRYLSTTGFHVYTDRIHHICRQKLAMNELLKTKWYKLFPRSETDDDDDDTFYRLIIELYDLITDYFLKIAIVDGLHQFKEEVPRTKKQALRSKVTALSGRATNDTLTKKRKMTVKEDNKVECPVCGKVCADNPKSPKDSSIGCDTCKKWVHFKCANLKGNEIFLTNSASSWSCSSCTRGRKSCERKSV